MKNKTTRIIRSAGALTACLLGCGWSSPAAHAQASSDEVIRQIVAAPHLSGEDSIVYSRDGKSLVFVTRSGASNVAALRRTGMPDTAAGAHVTVWDRASGQSTVPVNDAESIRPSWSPDGSSLAFYSNRGGETGLYVYHRGGSTERLGTFVVRPNPLGGDQPQWLNEHQILVPVVWSADRQSYPGQNLQQFPSEAAPNNVTLGNYTIDAFNPTPAMTGNATAANSTTTNESMPPNEDVLSAGVYDISAQNLTLLPRELDVQYARISPSGRFLAMTSRPTLNSDDGQLHSRLLVQDLQSGNEACSRDLIARHLGSHLRWMVGETLLVEDGNAVLALSMSDERIQEVAHTTLDGVALTGRPNEVVCLYQGNVTVFQGEHLQLRRSLPLPPTFHPERILSGSDGHIWEPAPATLIVMGGRARQGGREFVRVPLSGARPAYEVSDVTRFRALDIDPQTGFMLARVESLDAVEPRQKLALLDGAVQTRVTLEPLTPVNISLPAPRVVKAAVPYKLPNGEERTLTATVLVPSNAAAGKVPAVVYLYAGSHFSPGRNQHPDDHQPIPPAVLLSRGYAVVLPQLPPSGHDPLRLLNDLEASLNPQVDAAIAAAGLDPHRIALAGQSYGAYDVAGLLAYNHRYAAGISFNGVFDYPGMFGELHPGNLEDNPIYIAQTQGPHPRQLDESRLSVRMGAVQREYLEHLPLYLTRQIDAPFYLVAGKLNLSSTRQTRAMYTALKSNNKPAEMRIYNHAERWMQDWPAEDSTNAYNGLLDFLDRNLKG